MRNKTFRLLLLLTIVFTNYKIYGQHTMNGMVKGIITDSTGQVLAFTTVSLLRAADSALIKAIISKENGEFEFTNLPRGNYVINAAHQGYNMGWGLHFNLDSTCPLLVLPALQLLLATKSLKEITVSARKPMFEQKIDRMIVNVAGNITSAGSTALEVLERSPGIIVDEQNNLLSMNGKNGVVVMINGRINYMPMAALVQMLAGMSADNIEQIELITTPPSNLDAEGNAGYINIILKSNSQFGTNGSYSISTGYGRGEITEASTNFNHRKNKLNFYGNFTFSRIHSPQVFSFFRTVTNLGDTTQTASIADRDVIRLYYSGTLGLDYEIGKKIIFGMLVTGFNNRFSNNSNNNSTITINHEQDSSLTIITDEVNDWYNLSGNVNLQYNISAKENINLNGNYYFYKDNNPISYLYTIYDKAGNFLYDQSIKSLKTTPISIWSFPLEYSKKISGDVKLEAGIKGTLSEFHNSVEIDTIENNVPKTNDSLSNIYDLKENIQAVYSSFEVNLNSKSKIKAGLRYEHTNSNLSSQSREDIICNSHYLI
jgi:hypothetical protein